MEENAVPGYPGGLAVESGSTSPDGLAADAEDEVGGGWLQRCASPAALSVRAFLAAGGASSVAAMLFWLILRALVGGPSSAWLAAFLGLAAVWPPCRIMAALPRV